MPTPNLGLTQPTTGAASWGATLNTNFDLIDAAMEGLADDSIVMDDSGAAATIETGTANGTKLATTASHKLGIWGATPVIRPAHADQGAAPALTQGTLTDSSGGTPSLTLAAISDTPTKNAVASLAARLAEIKTDNLAMRALLNQIRADLVAIGLIKGSA